jgi:hypothetical protein
MVQRKSGLGILKSSFESEGSLMSRKSAAISDYSTFGGTSETRTAFYEWNWAGVISFESESKLRRIWTSSFMFSPAFSAICIHSPVQMLCDDCFHGGASLSSLIFESGSQLRRIGP